MGRCVRLQAESPECGCLTAAFGLAADGRKPAEQIAGVGRGMRTWRWKPYPGTGKLMLAGEKWRGHAQ